MNIGVKFDQGKAPLHMIPEDAILGMAQAFAYGAQKYGEYNYRNGIHTTRLTDSLGRHTLAYLAGENDDPESGLPHTYHILANAAMLEYMRIHRPEFDNRYKQPQQLPTAEEYFSTFSSDEDKKIGQIVNEILGNHKETFMKLKDYEKIINETKKRIEEREEK